MDQSSQHTIQPTQNGHHVRYASDNPNQPLKIELDDQFTVQRILKFQMNEFNLYPLDKQLLHKVLGQNLSMNYLREFFQEFPTKPKFTHGRVLQPGEPYFRCIDCEIIRGESQKTYYCRFCFEQKSHKGHRFLLFNDSTGVETCDCGDEWLLNKDFFCDEHGTCTDIEYREVLDNFPEQFKDNFRLTFSQAMYELTYCCEVQRRQFQGAQFRDFISKIFESIISGFKFCINVSNIFLVIISEVLTQNFMLPPKYKDFYFVSEKFAKQNDIFTKDTLEMTFLENMMRATMLMKEEYQVLCREFILKMATCHQFNSHLVLSYQKVFHRFFIMGTTNPFRFGNLVYLTHKAYSTEQNCLLVLKEGNFKNLTEMLRKYARNYQPKLDPQNNTLTQILKVFDYLLEKEASGKELIESQGIMLEFIKVFGDIQRLHSYDIADFGTKIIQPDFAQMINAYWNFEAKLFEICDNFMKNLGVILETVGWDQKSELYLDGWGLEAIEDTKENITSSKNIHLNLPLQRSMISYLQYTLDRIHNENIMNQLQHIEQFLPDTYTLKHLISQSVGTIGMMRGALIKHNFEFQNNQIVDRYFKEDPSLSMFDIDFSFVQLFSLLVDGEEEDLFKIYMSSFLGHDEEMINQFKNCDFSNTSPPTLELFADFLTFVVQIIHGEISFFNTFYKGYQLGDHVSQKILDQIHRKILVNFLHQNYEYFPITDLKKDFQYILRPDVFHEKILKDIADIEKKTRNFKLKKSFKSLFDSFYFYSDQKFSSVITKNVRNFSKKPEIADLGNFTQSLPFLNILQEKLFEGSVMTWILLFLEKFTVKLTHMVPPILRIILLSLKLLEHAKKNPLSKKCKENLVYPLFGGPQFLEKLKNLLDVIEDPIVLNSVAKLINIFVPKSKVAQNMSMSQDLSIQNDQSTSQQIDDVTISTIQNDSKLNETQINNNSHMPEMPGILEHEDGEIVCGICCKKMNLESIDVGIPAFVSISNMNYWEFKGKKFKKPFDNADKEEIRRIIGFIFKYFPYAEGLGARDLDLLGKYQAPRLSADFYPAITSCMHYFHKSCFHRKVKPIAQGTREFECPQCRTLNNIFIGMEKVDARSRKAIEAQHRRDKKFIDFLKVQGVKIGLLPDPKLRFDFYNRFMFAIFPHNQTLELKRGDPAADKKILRFSNLLRSSFFQLVRNSLINDFESFIQRSFVSYKFAFVNLQSFIMKNYQFHQFFEERDDMPFTIFHVLNHKAAMETQGQPTVKQLRDAFRVELGIEKREKKEELEKKLQRTNNWNFRVAPNKKVFHHEHFKKLPPLPDVFKKHKSEANLFRKDRNKQIIIAYDYKGLGHHMQNDSNLMMFNHLADAPSRKHKSRTLNVSSLTNQTNSYENSKFKLNTDLTTSAINENDENNMSAADEEVLDEMELMLLLLENDLEEDFLAVVWEVYLKFIVTGRHKEYHSNLDLKHLPIDFLYFKTLSIFGRTLISEGKVRDTLSLPDFDEICEIFNKDPGLRASFVEEMINLTQRIVISCILVFDFDNVFDLSKTVEDISDLKSDREGFLNYLLSMIKKTITVDLILSEEFLEVSKVYPKFFEVWRENMENFVEISDNPFEIFVKNVTEIRPLIIEIPVNFNDFNAEFLTKRCDKCGDFCSYCRTVVCLLCGTVLCRDQCVNPPRKNKKFLVDLNRSHDSGGSGGKRKKGKKGKKKRRNRDDSSNTTLDFTTSDEGNRTQSMDDSQSISIMDQSKISHNTQNTHLKAPRRKFDSFANSRAGNRNKSVDSHDSSKSKKKFTKPNNLFLEDSALKSPASHHLRTPQHRSMAAFDTRTPRGSGILSPINRLSTVQTPQQSKKKLDSITSARSPRLGPRASGTDTMSYYSMQVSKSYRKKIMASNVRGNDEEIKKQDTVEDDDGEFAKAAAEQLQDHPDGNMPQHSIEKHKGHTIFVGIQDLEILLFSHPRVGTYPEKLYVDRFGQSLSDKANIFEEDWNSFERNPYLIKRLRDTVENHKIPQLIYALNKGYDIKI